MPPATCRSVPGVVVGCCWYPLLHPYPVIGMINPETPSTSSTRPLHARPPLKKDSMQLRIDAMYSSLSWRGGLGHPHPGKHMPCHMQDCKTVNHSRFNSCLKDIPIFSCIVQAHRYPFPEHVAFLVPSCSCHVLPHCAQFFCHKFWAFCSNHPEWRPTPCPERVGLPTESVRWDLADVT